MFVILVYDMNVKRVGKAKKICDKYLNHIQKSVYEGSITEGKLKRLKLELSKLIDPIEDQCTIYILESMRYTRKDEIGIVEMINNIL